MSPGCEAAEQDFEGARGEAAKCKRGFGRRARLDGGRVHSELHFARGIGSEPSRMREGEWKGFVVEVRYTTEVARWRAFAKHPSTLLPFVGHDISTFC